MRRSSHALYLLFNWACIIIYAYQIYRWIRKGFWTRIPSEVLFPCAIASRSPERSGPVGRLVCWVLHVELAYSLCAVAIIFYALRWWADKKAAG